MRLRLLPRGDKLVKGLELSLWVGTDFYTPAFVYLDVCYYLGLQHFRVLFHIIFILHPTFSLCPTKHCNALP